MAVALALAPAPATGQATAGLVERCAPTAAGARCAEAAAAVQALAAQSGLLSGLGSTVPGAPSTLGRRLATSPRVALSLRAGGLELSLPDLTDRVGDPVRRLDVFVPTLHGSVTLGVFDGFRLLPTVGGFLSLDLVGATSAVFFPSSEGFDGRLASLSLGARIGLLRESFTLPGITLSVVRHISGSVSFGSTALGDPADVRVDPTTTALRLTVGKDLYAVGILAGVGLDRVSADATLRLATPGPHIQVQDELAFTRRVLYGGASLNFLVLQLSAELGWAAGLEAVPGYAGAPFDPTRGSLFASLAARLTL